MLTNERVPCLDMEGVEQSEGSGVSSKSRRLNIDESEPRLIAIFTWPNGTLRIIDPEGLSA